MRVTIVISTVADGSMYNRQNMLDPAVITNRTTFLAAHGMSINQTTRLQPTFDKHDFCIYREIDHIDQGLGMADDNGIVADAIITTQPNHALFLPVADCVGATIYDPEHHVLALAHLGRHNLEQGGAHKIIMHLSHRYGSNPHKLEIQLTPAAGKSEYKIWALDNIGIKEATHQQFASAGVPITNIVDNTAETTSDVDYYSYSEFLKGNRDEDGDHAIVAMITQ